MVPYWTDALPEPPPCERGGRGGAHAAPLPRSSATTLFVGQLPPEIAAPTLEALFGQFGAVVECAIIRDKVTHVGKGFAFVSMATVEQAQAAMHALHGYTVAGRRLCVAVKVRFGTQSFLL
jgi:RNA recognition motif-containing protein